MKHVGWGLVLDLVRLRKFRATDTKMTLIFVHFIEKNNIRHKLKIITSLSSSMALQFGASNLLTDNIMI